MCWKPARRTVQYTEAVLKAVEEGNLEGAERLLAAARNTMGPAVNLIMVNSKRVGEYYSEAQKALLSAKRSQSHIPRHGENNSLPLHTSNSKPLL